MDPPLNISGCTGDAPCAPTRPTPMGAAALALIRNRDTDGGRSALMPATYIGCDRIKYRRHVFGDLLGRALTVHDMERRPG